jgi:beta-glucanase (GH16 family)
MIGARTFFLLAAALAACAAPLARAQQSGLGGPFVDHLQTLDGDRWRVSDGWSNGSWTASDWRRGQISFGADGATVTMARSGGGAKAFSSGELQTNALYHFGYFEARLQAAAGSGLVNGFFTFTRPGDETSWDEIDVEILGRDTRSVQLTYFHMGAKRSITLPLGFDAAAAAHTYAFDWQAGYIRWYIDGRLVHQETGDGLPLPSAPQRLFAHMWNTTELTDWLGPIQGQGPWVMRVACVAQAATYAGRPLC